MDPLVVELLGPRGVGKSTLTELVLAELRSKNLAIEATLPPGLGPKVGRQLVTLADRLRFFATALAWRPPSVRDLQAFRKRYRRLRLSATVFSGRSGIRLIDEGVFQLIMELQAKTAQKDVWRIAERLSGLVTFPDLVLLVEAPEEAIEERRRRRGNKGDVLRPRVVSWERAALGHTRALLSYLAASGAGPELIVVNNSVGETLTSTAAKIANELATRYAEGSRPVEDSPGREFPEPAVVSRVAGLRSRTSL